MAKHHYPALFGSTFAPKKAKAPKMTETQVRHARISMAIAAKVRDGLTIREAFDAVLGVGAYDKLASEVYDTLSTREG